MLFLLREPNDETRLVNQIQVNKLAAKSDKDRVAARNWDENFKLSQCSLTDADGYRINVYANPQQAKLFRKLESESVRLGEITESSQGIILYKTAADAAKSKHTGTSQNGDWKRLLRGTNIGRYETKWGGEYVHYGTWLWCARDERFFAQPKILLQAMRNKSLARRLVATSDRENHYNAHNLANIIAKQGSNYDLNYILGCLNSALLNCWYKAHFPNVNINPNDFRQIPIRRISFSDASDKARHAQLVQLVEQMLTAKHALAGTKTEKDKTYYESKCNSLDKQIDALVYDLYGLTPEEIALVEAAQAR